MVYSDYRGCTHFLFNDSSYDEPQMLADGGQCAIVATHQAEAFDERGAVVAGGHAFLQVVGHGEGQVQEVVRLLHYTDAPIEIGRETECGVVFGTKVAPCVEGLVANEHPLFETAPCQLFGWSEAAWAKVLAIIIHNIGVAIEDAGKFS